MRVKQSQDSGFLLKAIIGFTILVIVAHVISLAFNQDFEFSETARAQSANDTETSAAASAEDDEVAKAAARLSDNQVSDLVSGELEISSRSSIGSLISERKQNLNEREETLKAKELLLEATLKDLSARETAVASAEQKASVKAKQKQPKAHPVIQKIAGVYSNMKPKDAARIFNSMDERSLIKIVSQLDAKKLAPILAAMNEKIAQRITGQLIGTLRTAGPPTIVTDNNTTSNIPELSAVE